MEELRQISDDSGVALGRSYSQGTNLETIYLKLTGKELRD
jgi:hypothetical protein